MSENYFEFVCTLSTEALGLLFLSVYTVLLCKKFKMLCKQLDPFQLDDETIDT